MSPRLPRVTADQILRVLRRLGFEEVRSSGSHRILRNAEGKHVTILRDASLSIDQLRQDL
jgi:predicted RNA binding protein YcfA (HicA-like mRNA interferase family)